MSNRVELLKTALSKTKSELDMLKEPMSEKIEIANLINTVKSLESRIKTLEEKVDTLEWNFA